MMSTKREEYMNNYGDQDRHNNEDVMLLYSIESGKRLLVHGYLFDSDTVDDINDISQGCRIEKEIQYIAKYLHYGYRKNLLPSEIYKCFLYILCDYFGFEESKHITGFPKPELLKRVML